MKLSLRLFLLLEVILMLESCAQKQQRLSLVDAKVLAVSIKENHEPLIDLRHQKTILFGASPEIPNNKDYTKVRKTIYEKLLEAQKALPSRLRLCLYEGYRSLSLQKKLFNDRYNSLKITHPTWSHEKLFQEATILVSPVINLDESQNIPPHSTGGAIDIYLVDLEEKIIDMGIKVEDWMKDKDGSLSQTLSTKISENAQKNRLIMSRTLQDVGFVNYSGEYWHWSYGDRYWAYLSGKKYALYGSVSE